MLVYITTKVLFAASASSGDPRGDFPTRYFGGMLSRGGIIPGKPICWTELGYLSPEGMPGALPPTLCMGR